MKEKDTIIDMLDTIEKMYYDDKELYDTVKEGLELIIKKLKEVNKWKKRN